MKSILPSYYKHLEEFVNTDTQNWVIKIIMAFFAFSLGHIENKLQEICNVTDVRNTGDMLYYIGIGQKTIWMGPRTFDQNKAFIEE